MDVLILYLFTYPDNIINDQEPTPLVLACCLFLHFKPDPVVSDQAPYWFLGHDYLYIMNLTIATNLTSHLLELETS